MRSVMKHNFSQVPSVSIPRSSFNRSHGYKTTFDAGYLVPVFVDEVLPGDTFNLSTSAFARLATPKFPFMDNMFLDIHYFFVPLRLIHENATKIFGEKLEEGDSTDYLVPTMTSPAIDGYEIGSLSDYFGIPTGIPDLEHSAYFHRAYNLIWNEYYRDENLQERVPDNKGDGPDDPADYKLLRRGKRHDYFTSALPWPQKGPSINLPLAGTAPVISTGETPLFRNANPSVPEANQNQPLTATGKTGTPYNTPNLYAHYVGNTGSSLTGNLYFGDETGLAADLSATVAATVNNLREAFQIQRIFEKDARGGTRYTEIIQAHFGVISPDARLQRPEYLGGGSTPINVNPVPQTSSTDSDSPQGNLAAYATAFMNGKGFTKSFTEHGVIIGLISARADLTYQNGLDRMFSRQTRFDFYWPSLAHLGEQEILNKEIYAQGTEEDDEVFGYQERYAEYRYKPSKITGLYRSDAAQSLDSWHLSQDFESLPALNSEFIEENPPVDRVIAVPSQPHFLLDMYFNLNCVRPMPVYSVPGLIDHF